jgi:UDP-GlcNAc:undecaprenyl-phosphate GlcNAc-1-phosphate transferase
MTLFTHHPILQLIVLFLLGTTLQAFLQEISRSGGILLDRPSGGLKPHQRPTPLTGGIGLAIPVLLWGAFNQVDLRETTLLVSMLCLGVWDDLRPLSARVRLGFQILAPLLLFWELSVAGTILQALTLALLVPIFVNAFNWTDGRNGLLAGSLFFPIAFHCGIGGPSPYFFALLPALIAFLVWNFPGRIFLGDGGSYFLGSLIALVLWKESIPNDSLSIGTLLLAGGSIPYFLDALQVLIRRRLEGRPLSQGDRNHFYDVLARRGWSNTSIVIVYGLATSLFSLLTWSITRMVT